MFCAIFNFQTRSKKEDVYKRSLQAAKKGRILIFHWRGGYLTKEVLKELLELIRKAGGGLTEIAVFFRFSDYRKMSIQRY